MTKQWCGFRDFCIASLQYLKTLQPAFSRQLHSGCRMGNIICGHMSDSPNQSCFGRWNWSIEATCTPLQGQRTSVLIYLHRLFTHVRHHKILKGKPLIDLLTCFYYKVFLSIWDVVWIMPEYMRTYKNTYAPSPHSHLNFTEHQSLKKLCIWQIECAVILILLWGFYPSKFDSHYLCIPTGAVLVAQVWCANSFPSAEMPERVDEWFSGVDSACFHLVNMPLRGAL